MFNELSDYLEHYKQNPTDLAAVPVPLVADFYGVTHAAIVRQLNTKKLKEIKIGKTRLVAISSLVERELRWERQCLAVRAVLEKVASEGRSHVFYEEIMTPFGMSTKVPADRSRIGGILGQISTETSDEHEILLSVLVHRKTSGITMPGPGFFELAENLEYEWEDDSKLVETETRKVLRHYAR